MTKKHKEKHFEPKIAATAEVLTGQFIKNKTVKIFFQKQYFLFLKNIE